MTALHSNYLAKSISCALFISALATILGWAWDITLFKSVLPHWPNQAPLSALTFVLIAVSLWCLAAIAPDATDSDLELVAALLRVDAPPALRCASGRPDEYARRGGSALTEGLRAQLAGDPAAARTALARAESEGVRDTVFSPYADLLVARLNGTEQVASVPDPPYPAWHRWALRWREALPR